MTIAAAIDVIRSSPPFDNFEPEALRFLHEHLTQVIIPAGQQLIAPEQGEVKALYILVAGQVRLIDANGEPKQILSPGECFPIDALSGEHASANTYTALTEVTSCVLSAADFHALVALSSVFSRHCNGYMAALVSQSRQELQARFAQQASESQSLNTRLIDLIKRQPIAVNGATSILHAIEIMGEHKVGSVIVVDGDGAPIGVLTQSDVVRRVVLGRAPLDNRITTVMTHDPATLPEGATAFDAIFLLASRGIRHVLLTNDAGRLSGVISERDLFALQRVGVGQVRRAIAAAETIAELQAALRDVQKSAFNMLAQGVGAEQLTQFISALNDAVAERVLEINLPNHDLHAIEWAWLAFGSEGREEQTLATDQDNGIIFLAPDDATRDAFRNRLLAFARDVNRDLDRCGFPLCKGNIMAGNPEWCLSLEEWKGKFAYWIRSPQPEALLNATIFFDFRPIYGERELAAQLHEFLLGLSTGNTVFQRMLAENALTAAPPLGMIRDFVVEHDDKGKAYIDLKKSGARLFVDGARVLAMANGVDSASTVKRLRLTAAKHGGPEAVEAQIDAFHYIQLLRLRHQHLEAGQGRPGDNRIFIDRLNQLDRHILKEVFRQAKALQQRLKLKYQI
jgi:CBS domain-containing protein